LGATVLIGQSLGAITALLVASERPDLVRGLVVAEASPAAEDASGVEEVVAGLPAYGGPDPPFDLDVMERMLRESVGRSFWTEWERIACPTLVVRAERGIVSADETRAMVERLPHAQPAELPGAGHDLHLDSPAEWRKVLSAFL
jgi:pimeloyl-ACP methyl ester carboxylesterase